MKGDFWHSFQIREKASLRVPVEPNSDLSRLFLCGVTVTYLPSLEVASLSDNNLVSNVPPRKIHVTLKTLGIRNYIINSCFFRLFVDLVSCMIHVLNILNNRCSFLLRTCKCCEPLPLGTFMRITIYFSSQDSSYNPA